MKIVFLLLSLLLLRAAPASSQTFGEWFRQKRTKENYLVQQIAALQAYSGTLRQGYTLARQGISTVRDIKNGDLGLHQVFFRSLDQVNPAIRDAPLLHDILATQAAITQALAAQQHLFRHPQFTTAERGYLHQVRANVLKTCARDLDTFQLLLTAGTLEMADTERLGRLTSLRRQVQHTYRFTRSFLAEAQLLALQRTQAQENTRRLHQTLNP
jgi:hypothetical protein